MGKPSTRQFQAACSRLRSQNPQGLRINQLATSYLRLEKAVKAKLTEIQIRLRWHHQRLRLDPFHGCAEVAIVRLLLRNITCLPCMQHNEHVLGICCDSVSSQSSRTAH